MKEIMFLNFQKLHINPDFYVDLFIIMFFIKLNILFIESEHIKVTIEM